MQNISRGKGRSAVASIAYRAGDNLWSAQERRSFDYTNKEGVVESKIVTPENAPEWASDRQSLWNQVEAKENRVNSNYAKEIEFALPVEFSKAERQNVANAFATDLVNKYGVVADYAIHAKDPNNPHVHLSITTRPLSKDGWGKKIREFDRKEFLMEIREGWAMKANQQLEKLGLDKIDHRTLRDQGITRAPTWHRGVRTTAMEKRLEKMNRFVDLVKGENYEPGRRLERGGTTQRESVGRSQKDGNERRLSDGARRELERVSDSVEGLAKQVLQHGREDGSDRSRKQSLERDRGPNRGLGR